MKLYISAGTHIFTRSEARREDIDSTFNEIEAVFLEKRQQGVGWTQKIRNWLACPFLLIVMSTYFWILAKAGKFLSNDLRLADEICEDYNATRYEVGKPIHEIISSDWYMWCIANWSLSVGPLLLIFVISAPGSSVVGIAFLLFSAIALVAAFVGGTNVEREVHMLKEIDRLRKSQDVKRACFIGGGHHEGGLKEYVSIFPKIKIIDKPD